MIKRLGVLHGQLKVTVMTITGPGCSTTVHAVVTYHVSMRKKTDYDVTNQQEIRLAGKQ
jgi:hypothetical protein